MSPEVRVPFSFASICLKAYIRIRRQKAREEQAIRLVKHLYEYYMENLDQLPNEYHIVIES